MSIFEIIGILFTLSLVLRLAFNLIKAFYPFKNLATRYGPGSWVVITGGSDGIGKGFARVLAKQGFSICLIARNPTKLNNVKNEIQNDFPQVQVKCITADFKDSLKPGFFDKIYDEVKDLDISILVNNVGIASIDYFDKISENMIVDALTINIMPQVLLTRKLINKLLARGKYKSAVISVSSALGTKPTPYDSLYSGNKAFNDFFSRSLTTEFQGRLDVLSIRPFFVSTALNFNKKPGIDTLTPEECAEGCLRSLGHWSYTFGHYKHAIQGFFLDLIPDWIFAQLARVAAPKIMESRKAQELKRKRE